MESQVDGTKERFEQWESFGHQMKTFQRGQPVQGRSGKLCSKNEGTMCPSCPSCAWRLTSKTVRARDNCGKKVCLRNNVAKQMLKAVIADLDSAGSLAATQV